MIKKTVKQGQTLEIYLQRLNSEGNGASLDGVTMIFQMVRGGVTECSLTIGDGITIRERAAGKYSIKTKIRPDLPVGIYKADCIYIKDDDCIPTDTMIINVIEKVSSCPQ